jgi:hypothetical protein
MTTERRYSESEIAAIFKQAAEAQEAAKRRVSHLEGLSLAELQQIGHEAGITPEFIVQAATGLDRRVESRPDVRLFGLPVGVERSAELSGSFTDADWQRLVLDLQQTFHASGKTRNDDAVRRWRNGNLHAVVGPGDDGHRLHIRTRKGDAGTYLWGGIGALLLGIALIVSPLLSSGTWVFDDAFGGMIITMFGIALLAHTTYRLPRWAKERADQMEAIISRSYDRTVDRETTRLRDRDYPSSLSMASSLPAPESVRSGIDLSAAAPGSNHMSGNPGTRTRG